MSTQPQGPGKPPLPGCDLPALEVQLPGWRRASWARRPGSLGPGRKLLRLATWPPLGELLAQQSKDVQNPDHLDPLAQIQGLREAQSKATSLPPCRPPHWRSGLSSSSGSLGKGEKCGGHSGWWGTCWVLESLHRDGVVRMPPHPPHHPSACQLWALGRPLNHSVRHMPRVEQSDSPAWGNALGDPNKGWGDRD